MIYVSDRREEEGVWQMLTLADKGGRGGLANADMCGPSGMWGLTNDDSSAKMPLNGRMYVTLRDPECMKF